MKHSLEASHIMEARWILKICQYENMPKWKDEKMKRWKYRNLIHETRINKRQQRKENRSKVNNSQATKKQQDKKEKIKPHFTCSESNPPPTATHLSSHLLSPTPPSQHIQTCTIMHTHPLKNHSLMSYTLPFYETSSWSKPHYGGAMDFENMKYANMPIWKYVKMKRWKDEKMKI
jgi:hypothetical protein